MPNDRKPGDIIDISQSLSREIAVWPGDTRFSEEWVMSKSSGCSCNVSTVRMSVHTGTHADAPYHFKDDGKRPAEVDLARYVGPCHVVRTKNAECVIPADFAHVALRRGDRILFRTPRSCDANSWRDDFTYLGVDAARVLRDIGVVLVGIDTPSMDAMTSKTLDAHHTLAEAEVALLENLVLEDAPEGRYELIALPLKFRDIDASPVRAVLRVLE